MIKDDKIRNDNKYGDVENDVVIKENIEDQNQHKNKNSKIKSLHQDDENNIIHHHFLNEPIALKNMIKLNYVMNMIQCLKTVIKKQHNPKHLEKPIKKQT